MTVPSNSNRAVISTVSSCSTRRLRKSSELEKSLSRTQVGVLVGLGFRRKGSVSGPEIDEGLHGLELMRSEHIERCCGQDEVTEATVELLLQV